MGLLSKLLRLTRPRPKTRGVEFHHIVATDTKGCIGLNNTIPWKCKEDMSFFKTTTMGHIVIVGRKTYQSFYGNLPGRVCIVISRTPDIWINDGHHLVSSPLEAIKLACKLATNDVYIIGGSEIYKQTINYIDGIIHSTIPISVLGGDSYYPDWANLRKYKMIDSKRLRCEEGTYVTVNRFSL